VLAVLLVGGAVLVIRDAFFKPKTITAYFTTATGIYPGDQVRVSRREGRQDHVDSARWHPDQDDTDRRPRRGRSRPTQRRSSSRRTSSRPATSSSPAYRTSGPTMPDGAVIGVDRTAVPVEWDEVKDQLMRLATDLGPSSPGVPPPR